MLTGARPVARASALSWLVVLSLGMVWVLDGLEVTIIGSAAADGE
ncbi:hypothetical protein ACFQ07_26990 [Actinomadura adrarensis]|uniref:MFS transporter n=1 Tax=Actinomadura adrarensis TaxID=1819600 RepID=A0ABW3CN29_9ACTN